MTEEEWLACDHPPSMIYPFDPESLSRRRVTLFAVASVRTTNGIESRPLLWEAVEAAERATADEDWTEVDRLFQAAVVASRQTELGSASRDWADAVSLLTCSTLHKIEAPRAVARAAAASSDQTIRAHRRRTHAAILRDIFGNPFRPVTFSPEWRTFTVVALAQQMYESRDFSAMPILADAFQDAGCDNADVLDHCRVDGPHVPGCWLVDLVLSKT